MRRMFFGCRRRSTSKVVKGETSPNWLATHRTFLAGVFLLVFSVQTGEGPQDDAGSRLLITRQILDEGRLHLPSAHPSLALVQTPDGWTSYFGIGQTLLFVPFEFAGRALSLPFEDERAAYVKQLPLNYLYSPLVAVGYFAALAALLETLGLTRRESAFASLLFTFSTLSAHYVAQSFQEEAVAGTFACLCLNMTLLWRRLRNVRYIFGAGVALGCMLLFRMTAVFVSIPAAALLAGGLWAERRSFSVAWRRAAPLLYGLAAPATVHAFFAYLRFGDPFSTGYDQLSSIFPRGMWTFPGLPVLWDVLLGTGKGLFTYSPLLLIAIWGVWADRKRNFVYGAASLAALACSAILSAAFVAPDGCWSWGMRYQVHLLPLFAYFAWAGARDLIQRRFWSWTVPAAVAFGVMFQLSALVAPDRLEYNQLPVKWTLNPPQEILQEGCRLIQERQFVMRLENIVTVIRTLASGKKLGEIPDPFLRSEFGYFWAFRLARDHTGWKRAALAVSWLTLLGGAAFCLYREFRGVEGRSR